MIAEEFKEKTIEETQTLCQGKLDEYISKISEIKDIDELKKLEEELVKEQDEYDKYVQEQEFELKSEGVEFEGKKYTQSDVHKKILYFLSRIEQSFEYCLGLHGLNRIWKQSDLKKIGYGAYDSTLRLLGQLKFKGDSEWVDILIINNYMAFAHEGYVKIRTGLMTLAEMHNKLLDRMKLITPVEEIKQQE